MSGNFIAFVNFIKSIPFEYACEYLREGCLKPEPQEWIETTQEILNENDCFQTILEDCFEIGENFRLSKKELERRISQFGIGNFTLKEICKELQKKRFKYDKNTTKNKERGVFKGIRLKPVISLNTESKEEET